jgi:hypothetical protein
LRRQKLLRVPYLQSIHAGRAAVSLGGRLVWRTHLLNSRMRIMALRAARALAGNRQRPATQTTAVVAGGAGPAQPACLFKPPTAAGDPVAEQKREAVWAVWSVVGVVCMILLLLGRILSGPVGPVGPANRLGRLPVPPGAEQNTNESLVTPAVTSPAETVPNDHDPFAAVEMQPQPAFGVEPVAVPERTIPKESPSQPPLVFVEPIRPEPPQLELHLQARPTAAAVARHLSRSGEFDKTFVVEAQTKPVRPEIPSPFANDDRWSSFDVARWQLPTQPVAFRSDDADLSAADMPLASESKASVTATRSFAASTIVRSP